METTQDYMMAALKVLGALGLLIYGMRMMSDALQKLAGSGLRHILARMTTNRFAGMLTGAFVTCAVQSSSATTVMTVSFVSAGLLTLAQAISVIMGANIGTTLTAWIMSLGYNVDLPNGVFPAFFAGMVLIYKKQNRYVGDFLFGIAFMFLSLVMLSKTGHEMKLEENEAVVNFFASFDTSSHLTIVAFLVIGTVITCVVQSSAAVMAITILLCSTGVLPIYLGIALVMGENIGTTATANLAALGANREARRAALAHLLFNVFGVTWVMLVFYPFVNLVCQLTGYDPAVGGQPERLPVVLAMFHTCFNVTNTLLLIGFIPQMARVVYWLMPDKKGAGEEDEKEFRLKYIHASLMQTPEIAVLQAQRETQAFAERLQYMFGMLKELMDETDDEAFQKKYEQIADEEETTDQLEIGIARFLEQVGHDHLSDDSKTKVSEMMRLVSEMESTGDAIYKATRSVNRLHEKELQFSESQREQLHALLDLCEKGLVRLNEVMTGYRDDYDMEPTFEIEGQIKQLCLQLRQDSMKEVYDGDQDYTVNTIFMDFVRECRELGSYIVNAVQARLGE